MANIYNLVLICVLEEDAVKGINKWLQDQGHNPLEQTSTELGGNRTLECDIFAGAYSRFDDTLQKFIWYFNQVTWKYPENVVLIIEPPVDDMKVYRPLKVKA